VYAECLVRPKRFGARLESFGPRSFGKAHVKSTLSSRPLLRHSCKLPTSANVHKRQPVKLRTVTLQTTSGQMLSGANADVWPVLADSNCTGLVTGKYFERSAAGTINEKLARRLDRVLHSKSTICRVLQYYSDPCRTHWNLKRSTEHRGDVAVRLESGVCVHHGAAKSRGNNYCARIEPHPHGVGPHRFHFSSDRFAFKR
jgi:hypothetical protein